MFQRRQGGSGVATSHRWDRKLLAATAAMALVLTVSACTSGGGETSAKAEVSVLDQIIERGSVRVGVCLTLAPFGFYDAKGVEVGFDIDIAKRMAEELGVKLELVEVQNKTRIPSVTSGQVDVVMCDITGTPERAKAISFTRPYVAAGIGVAVPADSDIRSLSDLDGKTIGVTKGGLAAAVLGKKYPAATIKEFDDTSSGVLALRQGQVDAFSDNRSGLELRRIQQPGFDILPGSPAPVNYDSFGVKRGQYDWLIWLDNFILQLVVRGEMTEMYTEWFQTPPPFGVNEFANAGN